MSGCGIINRDEKLKRSKIFMNPDGLQELMDVQFRGLSR